ncbi:Zn-ribbon domain-containing OB-fold protein [Variovorax sp. Sphag1AA]|uniref:Zn-ribbon domain-containing OB-fold protein n=1 Tax=Variovorax sp. Sphag1AA TaxID=2587027 RepID=UPI0016171A71|nr:OB-fold domain-containing protein [Variovorax sp. Sphag1AA]MBB3177978.1 putative OB-fold protein [Variovorax sp. Sphag1AA]
MSPQSASQTSGASVAPDAFPLQDLQPSGAEFELTDGVLRLRGSVSRSTGSRAFPQRAVCLESGARDMEPMTFGPRGILYSYATVHVSSTRPTPYTIGYVDFENGVRVLASVEAAPEALGCDIPVELRAEGERWFVVPVASNEQGGTA